MLKMSWSVGPEARWVELDVAMTGKETVSIDGVVLSRKSGWTFRSEHDLSIPGHTLKAVIRFEGLSCVGELFVDGVLLEPVSSSKGSTNTWGAIFGAVGASLGATASRVFGIMGLIPFVIGLLVFYACSKAAPRRAQPFVPAVSVLGGHLGWMCIGALLLPQFDPMLVGEILLFAVLAGLLLARPSVAGVLVTGVLETVGLYSNMEMLQGLSTGNRVMRTALYLHVMLRAGVVILLAVGWWRSRHLEEEDGQVAVSAGGGAVAQRMPVAAPLATAGGPPAPLASPSASEWMRCGSCGLSHRVRANRLCPRCGATVAP